MATSTIKRQEKPELLWTRTGSGAFAAQSVSVDLSDFSAAEVLIDGRFVRIPKGAASYIPGYGWTTTGGNLALYRSVTVRDSYVSFGDCVAASVGSKNWEGNLNTSMIPTKIYGVK